MAVTGRVLLCVQYFVCVIVPVTFQTIACLSPMWLNVGETRVGVFGFKVYVDTSKNDPWTYDTTSSKNLTHLFQEI